MVDASTKKTLQSIPLLQTKASPRDKELWIQRLKEEYQSLIKVKIVKINFHFKKIQMEIIIVKFFSMCKTTSHRIQIGLS